MVDCVRKDVRTGKEVAGRAGKGTPIRRILGGRLPVGASVEARFLCSPACLGPSGEGRLFWTAQDPSDGGCCAGAGNESALACCFPERFLYLFRDSRREPRQGYWQHDGQAHGAGQRGRLGWCVRIRRILGRGGT